VNQPRYQNSGGSKLLFLCEILLIAACFYAAAKVDLDVEPSLYFLYEGGLARLIFATATVLLAMYFHHLYTDVRVRSRVLLIQQLCEVFGIALVAQSVVVYAKPDWILPRWLMIYGALFSLLAIFTWRVVYSQFVLNIVRRHRIVFVGRNQTVRDIAREIANTPGWGYEVLGFITDPVESNGVESETGKYLGPYSNLGVVARRLRPDRIVVGLEDRRARMPFNDLLQLHYDGLAIEEACRTYEQVNQKLCTRDLDARDLIFSHDLSPAANALSLQRGLDRFVGGLLFIVSIPLIILVAAGLRLTGKEPILVRSRRVGFAGEHFDLLRFRRSGQLGPLYRRLHLDALPELINVLRGDIALVGPRPESPEDSANRALNLPLYEYRFNVPPGMTGWAQINLTHEEQEKDPRDALEYDLYYIKHMSQALNAYILMTTLKNRLVWGDQRP
jgi:lipopolysaccharide/colanic/teichoic acid biosynthesis glycosyltransferase